MCRPRRPPRLLVGCLLLVLAACSPGADVTADELDEVIARDAVMFEDGALPIEMIERMAAERVVLLGETHHLREHWTLVADLVSELHARGFRQLLVESPHMAGWLFDDYVLGGPMAEGWQPSRFYAARLDAIRAFNETLPAQERVHVRAIDANEEWYGGAAGFQELLGLVLGVLPTAPVDLSLPLDYAAGDPDEQSTALDDLAARLEEQRSALLEAWGAESLDRVTEMVEVEATSITVRAQRRDDDDAAARTREELIKALADRRIAACSCGTIINIGGHHAQKSHLMGTDQEWMGDYLSHASTVVDGSILVVVVSSARTRLEPGAGGTPFDVTTTSPEHELLRRIAEAGGERTAFLPLDDPLFTDGLVAYNSEDVIHVTRLREQFDAVLQYGIAHRMPEA